MGNKVEIKDGIVLTLEEYSRLAREETLLRVVLAIGAGGSYTALCDIIDMAQRVYDEINGTEPKEKTEENVNAE